MSLTLTPRRVDTPPARPAHPCSVTQAPFDPLELFDGAPANLTAAPGGAVLFTYSLPPLPAGVPLWEVEFLLSASARQLPLSRKDVVLTVAMVPEVALVGLASETDASGPGRNPTFPAPYVSGVYTGCAHPPRTHPAAAEARGVGGLGVKRKSHERASASPRPRAGPRRR